jgi:hypothetical protein
VSYHELSRDPIAAPTAAAVHNNLFIFWNSLKIQRHRILRYQLPSDIADVSFMRFTHIEQKEVFARVETSL